MRKLLFFLVLATSITLPALSQNLPMGGRTRSECGFMTSDQAFQRAVEVKKTAINPVDEGVSAIITSQQSNGSWCYQIVITCNTPGLPALPSPPPVIIVEPYSKEPLPTVNIKPVGKYFRVVEMRQCFMTPQLRDQAVNSFKQHYQIAFYTAQEEWCQGSAGVCTEYCAHYRGVEFALPLEPVEP